jgi:hypothetical protein
MLLLCKIEIFLKILPSTVKMLFNPIDQQCAPVHPTYFFPRRTPDDFIRQWGSSAA